MKRPTVVQTLKTNAAQLKQHTLTVYFAARDPRTPVFVRLLALFVAAYALSPIDLIPDFIPVLGYLDDLLIVPLGIMLAVKLVPAPVMADLRVRAMGRARPKSIAGLIAVLFIWAAAAGLVVRWLNHDQT